MECIVFPHDLLRNNGDLFLGMNQNPYKRISKNSLVFSLTNVGLHCKDTRNHALQLGSRTGDMKVLRYSKYTANAYRQRTDKLMFKSVISTVR